jgi:hypothetical protein
VLSRTSGKPIEDERFASGVKRLLELGEGPRGQSPDQATLFALPHDDMLGASERAVGGERKASAFSPLYKAYPELFQRLFPLGAEDTRRQRVLERFGWKP